MNWLYWGINRSFQVDHQLFALSKLDITGDGREEVRKWHSLNVFHSVLIIHIFLGSSLFMGWADVHHKPRETIRSISVWPFSQRLLRRTVLFESFGRESIASLSLRNVLKQDLRILQRHSATNYPQHAVGCRGIGMPSTPPASGSWQMPRSSFPHERTCFQDFIWPF